MREFEIYFENEFGDWEGCIIEAKNVRDMIQKLKAKYPDDIGADGFYTEILDPCEVEPDYFDEDEKPLNW